MSKAGYLDYHYLAGLFDGKGYIDIQKHPITGNFTVRLAIKVSSKELASDIRDFFDCGSVTVMVRSNARGEQILRYRWIVSGDNIITCLDPLLPHMRLHKKPALFAILVQKQKIGLRL